jgi:flavin-binding protein dodecin
MFSKITPVSAKKKAVDKALKRLSSVDVFKVHGRMIDGNAAKTELKLNVRLLSKDNLLWEALWEYYVRADMMLSKFGVSKVIESRTEVLIRGRSATE